MRQEKAHLAPERPAVGSQRVIHRLKGAVNSFQTMYFALRYAEWLARDRSGKGAVAEQYILLHAVLRARGPLRVIRPDYTRGSAPISKGMKRFGGDLVELQYAALLPLHQLQRRQIFTESRAKGFVRTILYVPSKSVCLRVDAVRNGGRTWRTPFAVVEHL